jgi:hypothetical protein
VSARARLALAVGHSQRRRRRPPLPTRSETSSTREILIQTDRQLRCKVKRFQDWLRSYSSAEITTAFVAMTQHKRREQELAVMPDEIEGLHPLAHGSRESDRCTHRVMRQLPRRLWTTRVPFVGVPTGSDISGFNVPGLVAIILLLAVVFAPLLLGGHGRASDDPRDGGEPPGPRDDPPPLPPTRPRELPLPDAQPSDLRLRDDHRPRQGRRPRRPKPIKSDRDTVGVGPHQP